MPAGLDIEREQNINGSMAAYAEQVLVSTGRSDWPSRIEEDEDSVLAKRLKTLVGPKGKFSDVISGLDDVLRADADIHSHTTM